MSVKRDSVSLNAICNTVPSKENETVSRSSLKISRGMLYAALSSEFSVRTLVNHFLCAIQEKQFGNELMCCIGDIKNATMCRKF